MTDPTDTERLLAEARESRQFWRDGWIALDRDNVALAAKVRELEGERAGMAAKYALVERDVALAQVARIESITAYTWRDAEFLRLAIRKCLAADQPAKGEAT